MYVVDLADFNDKAVLNVCCIGYCVYLGCFCIVNGSIITNTFCYLCHELRISDGIPTIC